MGAHCSMTTGEKSMRIKKNVNIGKPLPGIEKSPCCKRDIQDLVSILQKENKLLA